MGENSVNAQILAQIQEKERAYQTEPHSGTRCQLLNAYLEAAGYASDVGGGYDAVAAWLQKASDLALEGVRQETSFYSLWDAAVVGLNWAEQARKYFQAQVAMQQYDAAAAYLRKLIAGGYTSEIPGCDPQALLARIEAKIRELPL